jgi:apolipoprotein N-acyltransferase
MSLSTQTQLAADPQAAVVTLPAGQALPSSRSRLVVELGVCVLCGMVLAWPFRSYDGSLPVFFALAPVLYVVTRQTRKWMAALCAAVFALTWTMLSFVFLWHLTAGGTVALSVYSSLFYVAGLLLIRPVARSGGTLAIIGTASLWALIEIARSIVPVFGFPWMLLGHALLYNDHLRQGADLFGVYGLSFVVVAINAALAIELPQLFAPAPSDDGATVRQRRHRAWRTLCFAGALWLGTFCYGEARLRNIESRLVAGPPIGIIQGNIVQKLGRSDEEKEKQLYRHIELHRQLLELSKAKNDIPVLVCWAETMVPDTLNEHPWGTVFKNFIATTGVPTLAGSNYVSPEDRARQLEHPRVFNTVYSFDERGRETFHFFKRRLVPFGEYIPFSAQLPILLYFQAVTRDQYTPGTDPSPVATVGSYHVALNICVEDIFPDLARECCRSGADTLINITNDGWFYNTFGPRAHLQAAAWRAIETRRPLLRVTNTGWTASIDPLGNVTTIIPPETEGIEKVRLQRISDGPDQFAKPTTLAMMLGERGAAAIFLSLFLGCFWLGYKGK